MVKRLFFSFALVFSAIGLMAQTKQLTIKDAVIGQYTNLYPEYIPRLRWVPQSTDYTFVKHDKLMRSNIKSKKDNEFLSTANLQKIFNDTATVSFFPDYKWIDATTMRINYQNKIGLVNTKQKKLISLLTPPENAEHIFVSGDNRKVAYTKDNNLFFMDKTNTEEQITNDPKGVVNGDIVARNEFGIDHGIFWSPKSNFIAFYHKDQRMVTDYPLVNITTRIATVENIKYPMAGMTNEKEQVGIYNIATGKTIFLDTDTSKDQFLTAVTWGPEEKYFYVGVLNRQQNHLKLNKYDVTTGKFVKTLFEEKNDKYVEPMHPLFFLDKKPNEFLWISRRDGWAHFYLYNTDGKLIRQVTSGDWEVTGFLGFDAGNEKVFFMATEDSPLEQRAYYANLTTKEMHCITKTPGTHHVSIGKDGTYFIDNYSNVKVPREYNIVNLQGKTLKNILTAADPLTEYDMPKASIFTIKDADDKENLFVRVITPPHLDKTKKYPVIIYVYGGPHAQLITNSWLGGAQMWLYYMAQKGYICFTVDNRGSENRGFAFESIIHRQVGQTEMRDQMEGVKYLKSLAYVDTNRIGVFGWSYGGFMTTSLMTNYPKTFKVGVAGGPVIDWKYYEVMYGERYMDMPQENPDGYKLTSLLNDEKIKTLKGRKLLIIHGGIDKTVVWQNSLRFIRECVKENVPVDYFVYPRSEHNVRGYDRIHLMDKITMYFDDYLGNYYQRNGK